MILLIKKFSIILLFSIIKPLKILKLIILIIKKKIYYLKPQFLFNNKI